MLTDTMMTKPLEAPGNRTQVFTSKLSWRWGGANLTTQPGASVPPRGPGLQAREFRSLLPTPGSLHKMSLSLLDGVRPHLVWARSVWVQAPGLVDLGAFP